MTKIYKLNNLGCAHCASKMENAISKLKGVKNANISFMAQKLLVEFDNISEDAILEKITEIIKKIEPECEVEV